MNTRLKVASGIIGDFFKTHKKSTFCFSIVFLLGIVVGIVVAVNSHGGEFQRIEANEIDYGAVKVFFFSALIIGAGYFVIAIAAVSRQFGFISVAVFFALGLYLGRYTCVLVGCYGGKGIVNLIFVYLPFFLVCFACMLIAACLALKQASVCECERGSLLRPSVLTVLKLYGINVALDFVIFLIVGGITKVIVVVL